MKYRFLFILIGGCVLVLSILACTFNLGGPEFPSPVIPYSTEAAGNFKTALETAAINSLASGQVVLSFSEEQLTSFLYYKLAENPKSLVTEPQVTLREGQLQVFGIVTQGTFQANCKVTFETGIDNDGQVRLRLTALDIGPLPSPASLNDLITSAIQEAFTGVFGPVATGLRLLDIQISNGTMTIIGQTK